jgi:enterobactin synthetase component D
MMRAGNPFLRRSALFPGFVAQCSVLYDPAGEPAEQFPEMVLPARVAGAVRKRQVEFAAGRFCAREALRQIGCASADASFGWRDHGAPDWPTGIVGAITHSAGVASAAVASTVDAHAIGLDVERLLKRDVARETLAHIATRDEVSTCGDAAGWSEAEALTLVFSAKETIFKCLYAAVGRYFDFHDAEIVSVDASTGRFDARLLTTLTPTLVAGTSLEGRFERDGEMFYTGMLRVPHPASG